MLVSWLQKTGTRLKPPHQTATRFGGDPGLPGMIQYIAWWIGFGGTFPPFHLSTFPPQKHLSPIVAPIYYRGRMVLICIILPSLSLPWVNLIIYKDDLRMMVLNSVAAKEGGMRGTRESKHILFMEASNVRHGREQGEDLLKTGSSISLKIAPKNW